MTMEVSRREFLGMTGLAAIVTTSYASAFEYNENGYNHLIPQYGDENFFESMVSPGSIRGVPQYSLKYKINDGRIIAETYIGPSKYAVSILTGNVETSIHLVDDIGDGIFRKKVTGKEVVEVPLWVYKKYGSRDKKSL